MPPENVSKLAIDSGGVRYLEATFRGTGASTTQWTVTAANTLWCAFPNVADAAAAAIEQCSAEAAPANPPIASR